MSKKMDNIPLKVKATVGYVGFPRTVFLTHILLR